MGKEMRHSTSLVTCFALATGAAPVPLECAAAAVTEVRFAAPEPFAGGKGFGKIGPYVRIKGVAKGELDPKDPRNKVIVNLDAAPVNARGMVEYEADVFILRPADPAKGAGKLLYEVTNRGNKLMFGRLHNSPADHAAANDPASAADAGAVPLAFERGYTMVWSGWDPDASTADNGMSIRVPVATSARRPIVTRIRDEIQIGTRGGADVEIARLLQSASDTDTKTARLTYRDREHDARVEIPSDQWAFVTERSIRLLPVGTRFQPRRIYELWYHAKDPKVAGIGFAATRDVVSFLRYSGQDAQGHPNPIAAPGAAGTGITHTMAFGISQAGRYLRHHIEMGMNGDENGRRVFDGVLAQTAGIGKVFANHAFAEAGRTATQHEDRFYPENWFPFSFATTDDPLTGRSGTVFRDDGTDPVVIATNTSTEYWQKGASLLTTDTMGTRDLEEHPRARTFLIAGTQHGGSFRTPSTPGACAQPRNPHDAYPALRALLVALDEWVSEGRAPPASRVPRIADGSAVPFEKLNLPKIPGIVTPSTDNKIGSEVDWTNPPARIEPAYRTLVPAVDADGNEIAGIRLPDQAVPVATLTGWNLYRGLESELCDRDGTYALFPKTKAEREATGDPRLSLEERYGSREAYAARLKAAADALVRERLLLPADADAYVKAANEITGF
jgi:hypothetical protein